MAGRTSRLADKDFARAVAEMYVAGIGQQEMADEFECAKDTIRVWVRDPRVQAHAKTMAAERVNRISRRLDGELEKRLSFVANWELDEILKVRKEMLERPLKVGVGEGTDIGSATNELSEAMDSDPEFAKQLLELAEASKASKRA